MNKIINWYKREKKILLASLLCGVAFTVLAGFHTRQHSYQALEAISAQVVRFHVLPNSNSEADQALKMRVKEAVLDEYHTILSAVGSVEEARELISSNLAEIESFAQNIVHSEGYHLPVRASLELSRFPTKQYGAITLPAGNYEALRIDIGSSSGTNWWCVMFPPLCFVDITRGEVPPDAQESLRALLSDSEYALIDNDIRESDPLVRVRFRIVEWWQDSSPPEDDIILVMGEAFGF